MSYTKEQLIEMAWKVRENAYAPYSLFRVGAAVWGEDGKVYVGANVENMSYGATICAERSALVSMVSAGCKRYKAIAVVVGNNGDSAPCAACRQVMTEFCESLDTPVYFGTPDGAIYSHTVGEIVPFAVMPGSLPPNED